MSATLNDGGPAFPHHSHQWQGGMCGMTLRDWFARNTPHDEVCEMTYQHLSLLAQERLAGMKKPANDSALKGEDAATRQIEVTVFHARVNAALRYISADAMIAVRTQSPKTPQ